MITVIATRTGQVVAPLDDSVTYTIHYPCSKSGVVEHRQGTSPLRNGFASSAIDKRERAFSQGSSGSKSETSAIADSCAMASANFASTGVRATASTSGATDDASSFCCAAETSAIRHLTYGAPFAYGTTIEIAQSAREARGIERLAPRPSRRRTARRPDPRRRVSQCVGGRSRPADLSCGAQNGCRGGRHRGGRQDFEHSPGECLPGPVTNRQSTIVDLACNSASGRLANDGRARPSAAASLAGERHPLAGQPITGMWNPGAALPSSGHRPVITLVRV
jgi:hypothetical protein